MKMQRFGSFLVAYGLVAAIVVGCGGSSARRTQTPSDDAGTGNGGDSSETGGGHGGRAGAGGSAPKAGASNGGRGGSSAGSNATAGAPDDAGSGSVAADGGAGGSAGDGSAGEGGAGNEPVIDVGEGCIAPPSAPALSTATAGLPAAGLALWLRGDRGIYATEQQRVCAWADQSGNKLVLRAADYTAVGSGAHSLIAEVLVYNRALSTEERVSVDAALRSRYGIQ